MKKKTTNKKATTANKPSKKTLAFMTPYGFVLLEATGLNQVSDLKKPNPIAEYNRVMLEKREEIAKKINEIREIGVKIQFEETPLIVIAPNPNFSDTMGHQVLFNAIQTLHDAAVTGGSDYHGNYDLIRSFYGMTPEAARMLLAAGYKQWDQFKISTAKRIVDRKKPPTIPPLSEARAKAQEIYYDVCNKIVVSPWNAMELWTCVYLAVIHASGGTGPPVPGFWPP
jgi:hypothetical protein